MRNTVIKVGLLLCVLVFLSTNSVEAVSVKQLAITDDPLLYGIKDHEEIDTQEEPKDEETEVEVPKEPEFAPVVPPPLTYTVAPGDSLTMIADLHQTQWPRLFAKNTQIANPDILAIGEVIIIPTAEEELPERALPMPVTAVAPVQTTPVSSNVSYPQQARGSSAGNTYAAGNCTWYAKSRRPDLPNMLGNAGAWVSSAAAQGFATGSVPQAGAIGQQGGHVVYIESVNGDGTVTVSEMNWVGLGVVSSRTVSAGNFTYIY